jgi:hypothetical protein
MIFELGDKGSEKLFLSSLFEAYASGEPMTGEVQLKLTG